MRTSLAEMWSRFGLLVLLATALAGCRIATDDVAVQNASTTAASDADQLLPAVGPIPTSSHWHGAYVVRICNDVLPPFDSDADPLGIHSHGDGVMHVHPFFEASGYESATVGLFGDAMGLGLANGELRLPSGGVWRDGDLCDGVPGRVFVDRWSGPDSGSEVVRHFTGLADLRFLADGELYQIAFAPADSFPVVPPSASLLPELSNLGPVAEPWIDIDPQSAIDQVEFWQVDSVTTEPCAADAVPERVLSGVVRCFTPKATTLSGVEAVQQARAVTLNRQPAVEIRMKPALVDLIDDHFAQTPDGPLVLAIAIDGLVITAPLLERPPAGDRLIVSGGFSADAAVRLAAILSSD